MKFTYPMKRNSHNINIIDKATQDQTIQSLDPTHYGFWSSPYSLMFAKWYWTNSLKISVRPTSPTIAYFHYYSFYVIT